MGTLVTIIISSSIVKVRAFNDNDLLWSALGEDHLHNLGNAFNLYNLCLKSHPTDKTALDRTILEVLGNYTQALQYLNKSLSLHPNDTYDMLWKAYALEGLYDFPDSLKITNKLLSILPHNAEALHTKALILLADGNRTGALSYANQALKYDPKNDARYIKMVATVLGYHK